MLKLTGCREGEFTCSDGQCVTMEQRCDQISHCRDESDEDGCHLMVINKSYKKKVPPIGGVTKDGEVIPATVNVTIVLRDIIQIEETRHKIELKFSIRLKWHENWSQFYNLKRKSFLNALSQTGDRRYVAALCNLWQHRPERGGQVGRRCGHHSYS